MKLLLILLGLLAGAWTWRLLLTSPPPPPSTQAPPDPAPTPLLEDMPACCQCGLHLPRSSAVLGPRGEVFCSEAHRALGPASP